MKAYALICTLAATVVACALWCLSIRLSGNEIGPLIWVCALCVGYGARLSGVPGNATGAMTATGLMISFLLGRYFAARMILPTVVQSLAAQGAIDVPAGVAPSELVRQILSERGHQLAMASVWSTMSWVTAAFLVSGVAIAFKVGRGLVFNAEIYRIDRYQALKILEKQADRRSKAA